MWCRQEEEEEEEEGLYKANTVNGDPERDRATPARKCGGGAALLSNGGSCALIIKRHTTKS